MFLCSRAKSVKMARPNTQMDEEENKKHTTEAHIHNKCKAILIIYMGIQNDL